jgi:hypothetical protein
MRYSLYVKMRSQFLFFMGLALTVNLPSILYFLGARREIAKGDN